MSYGTGMWFTTSWQGDVPAELNTIQAQELWRKANQEIIREMKEGS